MKIMISSEVRKIISKALEDIGADADNFSIERSPSPELGDYSTNIALKAGDTKSATQIAKGVAKSDLVQKTEVKSGFVNIFLKPEVWQSELENILKNKQDYAHLTLGGEKTVNIEFISANPTGELHVGNGRGVFFGDVLANLLEKAGYNVKREYLINNAKVSTQIKELGKTALGKGEAYKTEYLEKIIKDLSSELENIKDDGKAGFLVAGKVMEGVKNLIQNKMGVRVDRWFLEEELHASGQVSSVLQKLNTYEKDGAVWMKTTEYGDEEDRVLIRSDGTPGYFISDIAYHLDKAARADVLIEIWGADHQGHVKRMMAAARALKFSGKVKILITQIVHVKEGGVGKKMSKRSGDTVGLEWLIDEVGLDAARFFYLAKSLNTHMDFDMALAKERSKKNPVYYVQYSHARANQIFAKAGMGPYDGDDANLSLLVEQSELALIKKLAEYPELIERIVTGYAKSQSYDLHLLTSYAIELSATFHKFYETTKVLVEETELKKARLALVRGYQIVVKDVLGLLGVSVPDKM